MLRVKSITSLMLTAAFVACGGSNGDEAATMSEGAEAAPAIAAAEVDLSRCFLRGATVEETADRPSPLRGTAFTIGETTGQICYGAPSARGREMVGGVDPYGQLWRMGANEATAIHLDGPATVGGVSLAAGSYSLYALPNEDQWEIFLNSNYERWGIPISDEVRATEIGSFTVTPEATDEMVETLTFSFEPTGPSAGELILEFEHNRVRIPVTAGM
jgi:hypothetical protein